MPKRKKRSDDDKKRSLTVVTSTAFEKFDDKKLRHTWLLKPREYVNDFIIDDLDLDVLVKIVAEDDQIDRYMAIHLKIGKMYRDGHFGLHERNGDEEYRLNEYGRRKRLFLVSPLIGQLDALKTLYLNYSKGTLPPEIGLLSKLRTLKISTLLKSAVLPPEIGNLRMLNELILVCPYMKSLFEQIGNLTNLKKLSLTECLSLTELPSSIRQLSKLKELGLPDWAVSALDFAAIGRLSSLKRLRIGSNIWRREWVTSVEPFRTGQWQVEGAEFSREFANLASLEEVYTYLSALLVFPVNYFGKSTKLTKMGIRYDVAVDETEDFSSIDVSYFSNIPSTLEYLTVCTFSKKDTLGCLDDDRDTNDNNDDMQQTRPKIPFPYQVLALQHNLRKLRIDGTGSTGIHLSFSMMRNLVKLENMHLDMCTMESLPMTATICLPLLTTFTLRNVNGMINFQEFDFPSLKDLRLFHHSSHHHEVTVRVSGHLPALERFSILADQYSHYRSGGPETLPVIFEYDASARLPELKKLLLEGCFFFGTTDFTAPTEALDLPGLQVLHIKACFGIFPSLSKWVTPCLHHVKFCLDECQQQYHAAIPACQQLDKLSTELLSRCLQLISLDLSGMPRGSIRFIPKAFLSTLPQSTRELDLTPAQARTIIVADMDNILELFGRCQRLGAIIGEQHWWNLVDPNERPSNQACLEIGCFTSLNRARRRFLIDPRPVIAALWPLILEDPLRAFKPYGMRAATVFHNDEVDAAFRKGVDAAFHHDDVDDRLSENDEEHVDGDTETNDNEEDETEGERNDIDCTDDDNVEEDSSEGSDGSHDSLYYVAHDEKVAARLLRFGVRTQPDAIFLLLRERFLMELLDRERW